MRKVFCDHCLKEIKGAEINEMGIEDCFFDNESRMFVGHGCTLCGDCWKERRQAHINLDMRFLNLVEEGME